MAERNTTTVNHAARTLIQDGGHIPPVTSSRMACKRSIGVLMTTRRLRCPIFYLAVLDVMLR